MVFDIFFRCYLFINRNFWFRDNSVLKNTDKRISTVGSIRRWICEDCPPYREIILMSSYFDFSKLCLV